MGNADTEKWKRKRKRKKGILFSRQKERCFYCGNKFALDAFTFDHVLRAKDGGLFTYENLVLACYLCNQYRETIKGKTSDQKMKTMIAKHRLMVEKGP